ncbi:type II secretion system protein [Pseudobacteriovorax antillogorgiicola]|uniref:Uncharacterized protein n=1 Tax=Pseudobacteriovorax antillogorgiicola TaxID=1513793 RepID=A0A1Y6CMN7_9BACT|nr:hypothetical protein [Pseudobacteriovorax antillogorgiicola]TCS44595.1 hypothetical protein EDD56_13228 [Pseudobacteriovorax antillogorgiicola]SMF78133.1 hypothetical protein SAMN06296036_13228 [Pseudobacteriovorax antillogorgiicola]
MGIRSGFSIVELLVAIAFAIATTYFAIDNILVVRDLARLTENKVVVSEIEESLRSTLSSRKKFTATINRNPRLKTCMIEDAKLCSATPMSLELWASNQHQIPLRYFIDGKTCDNDRCPLEVELLARGLCADAGRCDKAATILVDYAIFADGAVLRRGSIKRNISTPPSSDTNQVCPTGADDQKNLASDVRGGRLRCVPAPQLQRSITGVMPGDCLLGKQLLVGFSSEGDPLCQDIKFRGNP